MLFLIPSNSPPERCLLSPESLLVLPLEVSGYKMIRGCRMTGICVGLEVRNFRKVFTLLKLSGGAAPGSAPLLGYERLFEEFFPETSRPQRREIRRRYEAIEAEPKTDERDYNLLIRLLSPGWRAAGAEAAQTT